MTRIMKYLFDGCRGGARKYVVELIPEETGREMRPGMVGFV